MTTKELIKKKEKIADLLFQVEFPLQMGKFFDLDSDEMLDDKIKVLEALKAGKSIKDIPKFYDVLELYPGDDTHWD